MATADWISRFLGWTYTLAWSLSFYPQFLLNYRRKSSTGLSSDFVAINPTGHCSLLIVNLALYSSSIVRSQYKDRHDGHLPQVRLNDVYFSAHATVLATLTLLQSFWYKRDVTQRTSTFNRFFLLFVLISALALTFFAATLRTPRLEYLDVINYLSYIKLYISFAKYIPQVRLNYQRKSTVGWSIENILLDLTGGTLSLAQLILDSWIANDWRGVTGNPAKLGLAVLTLAFDAIFIVQHYILYRGSTSSLIKASPDDGRPPTIDEERPDHINRHLDERTDLSVETAAGESLDGRDGLYGEGRRKKSQSRELRRKYGENEPLLDPRP